MSNGRAELRISPGVRSALNKLERATDPVPLHNCVGESMLRRGLVVEPQLGRYRLTLKGNDLLYAMNDPDLTARQVQRMYQ